MLGGRDRNRRRAPRRARKSVTAALAPAGLAALALAGLAAIVHPLPASAASLSSGAATVSDGSDPGGAIHATVASSSSAPQYGNQYWLASSTGAVWPLGGAPSLGSAAGLKLDAPVVGITATPDAGGYWLVGGDGGVFGFGDASFFGSTGGLRLNQPVIGLTATPDGQGYWLFAADGGIFSYGDAHFYGSTGALRLNRPVVGMAATPDGQGYWLFAADGGIFSFGDAHFYGSTGALRLDAPVVSMAATPDAGGYRLVGADGGVFDFGDATFLGSLVGTSQTVARVVTDPHGSGYWEVTHSGDVYPFGTAASDPVPPLALFHTVLGPGDQAMEWAMAQIGKPYAWGGVGPGSFDCSGLVMKAWQAAGTAIPRVAADQYNFGTHVSLSQLQMGDLIFWATDPSQPSTIYHVALYIGGEHMVDAPHTGTVVQTGWIGGSGFVAIATRP